ncbi:hypothetical protein [Streptomyces stelliscabiei]|uniref:hypothetical protein n=1 Tax=Streptomyces stelliscabiei TaxID=146820 RepID=UPI003A903FD3
MTEIILMSDPRVAAVPVHDRDEPLVDVRGTGILLVDERRADATGAYALLRAGVLDRRAEAGSLAGRAAPAARRGIPAAGPAAEVLRGVRGRAACPRTPTGPPTPTAVDST